MPVLWGRSWATPSIWACPLSEQWISGLLFDGQRSKGYPARLCRQQQRLLIEYGEGEVLQPQLNEVRLGTRVGQAGYYLHLPQGAAFESPQGDALAALLKGARGERGSGWLQRLEGSYRLILVSVVVVLLSLTLGVLYGVPWLSRHIAHALPTQLEQTMGNNALSTLERLWLEPTAVDAARQQQVRSAFAPHLQRLAAQYPGHEFKVHFHASEALGANALALPGGIILFTDDLLKLAQDDDELVAILAHEAGHVVHRHGLRNVVQGSLALWVIVAITGDLSAASDWLVTVPALLVSLNYSRGMEREADDFARDYLIDSSVAPAHFAHILQRLEQQQRPGDASEQSSPTDNDRRLRIPDVLSSHPATPERIERFLNPGSR